MSKKDEIQLAPKLRFPEFKKSGKWEEKKLGEVGELISGQHLLPEDYKFDKKGLPYFSGISDFTNDINSVNKWTLHKDHTGKKGDTLITVKGSGVGSLFFLNLEEVYIGRQIMAVRPKLFNGILIYQILLDKKRLFEDLGSGNLIPGISRTDILNLKLPFPSLPEQQKIADCLSSLDECISAETRKLESLRLHKKGLMQNLFPAEGESVPKLRFPEFKKSGKWEVKKLGDVGTIVGGGTPSSFVPEYWNGEINWFTPTEINNSKYVYFSKRKISIEGLNNSSAKILPVNSILLTSRATIGEVAINRYQTSTNQGFQSIIPHKTIITDFLYYLVKSLKNKFLEKASGSTFFEISPSSVKSISIPLPPSLPEQKKIADFLSSLDECISSQSQKIASLKLHKKGLMQQLFPSKEDGN